MFALLAVVWFVVKAGQPRPLLCESFLTGKAHFCAGLKQSTVVWVRFLLGVAFCLATPISLPLNVSLLPPPPSPRLFVTSSLLLPPARAVPRLSTVYHSSSPHKEFRFLLPVLPIAHAYAGWAVSTFIARAVPASKSTSSRSSDHPARPEKRQQLRRAITAVGLLFLHVPAAIYLSVWHQSGALSAVDAVARRIPALVASKLSGWTGLSGPCFQLPPWEGRELVVVHFLMPCHSAPLHSHLHFRGSEGEIWSGKPSLWSLDCSPK